MKGWFPPHRSAPPSPSEADERKRLKAELAILDGLLSARIWKRFLDELDGEQNVNILLVDPRPFHYVLVLCDERETLDEELRLRRVFRDAVAAEAPDELGLGELIVRTGPAWSDE